MKLLVKIISPICLFLASNFISAQVKIGDNINTIDQNSILELESTDKGFLLPRVILNNETSPSPLTAPVSNGFMVYSEGGLLEDGIYCWTDNSWKRLSTKADRENHYLVTAASDFPAPSGGIITLAPNSVYEISGTVAVSNSIDLNNSYIVGLHATNDKLIYTGSGSLFTGSNGGTIKLLTLSSGSGDLFNLDASSNPQQSILIRDSYFVGCTDIGLIKGYFLVFMDVVSNVSNSNGIEYEDVNYLLLNNLAWFPTNTGVFETITGAFISILKLGGFSHPPSGATALDISGISSISTTAELKTTSFSGSGTLVNGTFSNVWEVDAGGIPTEKDEVATGDLYISSSTTTVISSANTPVKVEGTTTASNLFRVASPNNNRLVYNGSRSRKFKITANMSFTASSSNEVITFHIAKNGIVINHIKSTRKIGAGSDIGIITIAGIVDLIPGDYVEVWVENNTSSANVTVEYMNFNIQ